MNPLTALLLVISAIVAVGRFTVPGHGLSYAGSYEAFAHIWVGALIVIAITQRALRMPAIALLIAITILETAMFIVQSNARIS